MKMYRFVLKLSYEPSEINYIQIYIYKSGPKRGMWSGTYRKSSKRSKQRTEIEAPIWPQTVLCVIGQAVNMINKDYRVKILIGYIRY